MIAFRCWFLLLLLLPASAFCQVPRGRSLPGACLKGDVFVLTDPTSDGTLYVCVSDNAWAQVQGSGSLPSQGGDSGKFLTTNGTSASWAATPKEVSFGICAGANCAVSDTISVPRVITTATAGTLTKCKAKAGTGPSGSSLTVDVKKNGTTTATVSIASGATLGNTTTFSAATLAEDDVLTILVTAIGSTTPSKDVHLVCTIQ